MIRLAIRVGRDGAERALAELLELCPAGVEEVDRGELVEYAVYGAPGELPVLPDLRAAAGGALVEVSTSEVADDWAQRWRDWHRPVLLDGRLHIRPPWAPAAAQPGVAEVVIDPGQAFGTGAHATTRLCLELMLELEPAGAFVDVGCGSGVLAIAASKLGWGPVHAIDLDPHSVAAARDNAAANDVEVEVERLDLRRDAPPPASTMAANLLRPLLLDLAAVLVEPPPERLVAGGLLAAEADELAAAFAERHGLRELARRERGEWAALLLESQSAPPGGR